MNTTKSVILVLIGAAVIAVSLYFLEPMGGKQNEDGNGVMCTADAMQCPDGSWVGRTGPNCQFECPLATSTIGVALVETTINQEAGALDVKIIPTEVVEDSRCPQDVQCIQAGTVRVRAKLTSGLGTANQVFTLNTPITTEAEEVTLVAVKPNTKAGATIPSGDYRFTFRITKR